MKTPFLEVIVVGGFLSSAFNASAQSNNPPPSPTEYLWTFSGLSCETNGAGKIVAKPISEKTMLAEAAAAAGVSSEGMVLVYHINGSSFGDTVDIVRRTNGAVLQNLFGYFFGYDNALGRISLTNGAGSQVKEIDYIYTSQNSHSLGDSFTTKLFTTNRNKTVTELVDGPMNWLVTPEGNNGVKVCNGHFTTGKPLF